MLHYKLSTIHYLLSTIFIAYLLDLIFGDPQWAWHPTRIIGRLIEKLERRLNSGSINRKFAGVILVILVVGSTALCVWGILKLAILIHPVFHFILSVLFIYFALSVKSLMVEVNKVYEPLRDGDIQAARKNLAMIVGRDTDRLDEPGIVRAVVETVAESAMDAIIAPLFYVFLGGPVLVWVYKAINTLDSMVGYRSERFIDFGWASAKIDGLVNFIPARLTCIIISISSLFFKRDWINSGKWALRYFFRGLEYNSEATEATLAGSLGVQLGGLNFYNSVPVQKNIIGDNIYPLDIKHIKEGIKIVYTSSVLFMVTGISLIWVIGRR
jgi:adenosylcobinamide-phosphate synthase